MKFALADFLQSQIRVNTIISEALSQFSGELHAKFGGGNCSKSVFAEFCSRKKGSKLLLILVKHDYSSELHPKFPGGNYLKLVCWLSFAVANKGGLLLVRHDNSLVVNCTQISGGKLLE